MSGSTSSLTSSSSDRSIIAPSPSPVAPSEEGTISGLSSFTNDLVVHILAFTGEFSTTSLVSKEWGIASGTACSEQDNDIDFMSFFNRLVKGQEENGLRQPHRPHLLPPQIPKPDKNLPRRLQASQAREWMIKNPQILDSINRINLSRLNLKAFPYEIKMLKNLEHIEIRENAIKEAPEWLCLMEKLTYIVLDDNLIDKLPSKVVALNIQIYLMDNPLRGYSPKLRENLLKKGCNGQACFLIRLMSQT